MKSATLLENIFTEKSIAMTAPDAVPYEDRLPWRWYPIFRYLKTETEDKFEASKDFELRHAYWATVFNDLINKLDAETTLLTSPSWHRVNIYLYNSKPDLEQCCFDNIKKEPAAITIHEQAGITVADILRALSGYLYASESNKDPKKRPAPRICCGHHGNVAPKTYAPVIYGSYVFKYGRDFDVVLFCCPEEQYIDRLNSWRDRLPQYDQDEEECFY